MLFLGERPEVLSAGQKVATSGASNDASGGTYSAAINTWMRQNALSSEEVGQVFHFKDDGSFDIHDVPGTSKKDKTLNTYILAGVGTFLMKNERAFDDATARGFCERLGCYDRANHAAHLKAKHPEFSGDKKKGYSLTHPGVKRGAELVKELTGSAK
jgi:hypothetical protein